MLVVVVAVLLSGRAETPAPPPATTPPPVAIAPVKSTPEIKPLPVDTGPEGPADRIPWLLRQEKMTPEDYKRWHAEWSSLLPRVLGMKYEQPVRDELERIEGNARKAHRALFRPVREKITELTAARKVRDAIKVLQEWKIPEGLDLRGDIADDLKKELARLNQVASIDETAAAYVADFNGGRDPGDPRERLKEFLEAPDIGIRMPAEYALRSLTVYHVRRNYNLAMDARRPEATRHVEAEIKGIAAEGEERKKRVLAWEKRLQEGTRKNPLSAKALGMSGAMTFRVLKYDGASLNYGNDSVELKVGIDDLSPASLGLILEIAADPADAPGLFEAGCAAVRAGALDSADRLLKGAIKVDPNLAKISPSVEKLRVGVGKLRGQASISGDKVSLAYTFDRPDEAEDFSPLTPLKKEIRSGSLFIEGGKGLYFADVGNITFSRQLRFKARPKSVDGQGAYIFGARWEVTPGDLDLLLVLFLPGGQFRIVAKEGQDPIKVVIEGPLPGKTEDFELVFDEKKTELTTGGKSLWKGPGSASAPLQAVVGGASVDDAEKSGVSYAGLELQGRGAPVWIQQVRSERRALVEAELSKEVKVLAAAAPKTWIAEDRTFGYGLLIPLPIEEKLKDAFTEDSRKQFDVWRAELKRLSTAKTPMEVDHHVRIITAALDAVIKEVPWLPLGYFYRAEWKYRLGDLTGALKDLDESLARHENFVEAHLAKADLHRYAGRYEEAGKSIEAALAAVPDLARPRLTRALLRYYADRPAEAIAELQLAMRLAPNNLGLRLEAMRLAQVVAGPRWSGVAQVDTDNYIVRGEVAAGSPKEMAIAKERTAKAAKMLEVVRRWFEELVPGSGRRVRKPIVYLFQSPESYYLHADLTRGDRLEHSLGVFFPAYQQLMFFMGGSEEETLSTMIHESFHEYLNSLASNVPPWLNEGFAEYVSGIRIEGDAVVESGLMLPDRLATLRRALKRGFKGIPFPVILNESHAQFMAFDPALQYAQAWSMVHFLIRFDNGRYAPVFKTYLGALLEGKSPSEALKTAFGGLELVKIQREWLEYIKKF